MLSEQGYVLEALLGAKFICQTSDEDAWLYLQNEQHRQQIEQQLNVLNRTLATAAEGEVYFAAYQDLADNERKQLSTQFQEICANLLPLVEWMTLVQEAKGDDLPLTQGSHIRLNELQTVIEDTPAFSEQLEKISRYPLFKSQASEVDNQLKQVFKRLVDTGYLIKPNSEKQIYLATGKIDYLFDVLKFIDETEALSLAEKAEDAMTQTDLL